MQAAHACYEAARAVPDSIRSNLVILSVDSEEDLLALLDEVESKGIRGSPFVEPDLGNITTAFATEPISGGSRKLFKDLPLLKFKRNQS